MNSGSYNVGAYLQVPLHNSSYNIKDDPFLKTLVDDPYTSAASIQVYFLEILSAFAILLVLPSFVWHVRNRNLPASSLFFWTLWLNLMNIINAIIWPTDALQEWWWGFGLCDIAVKMDIASSLGIIGAVVCILRSLAMALNTERIRVTTSHAEKLRKRIIESLYCIGLPTLAAVLHFMVQTRRYYIYAISGCMYTVGETWMDVVLLWMWPPFLTLVAAYHAGVVLVRVMRYRSQFIQVLSASTSGMNKARFVRLYSISLILLLIYLPLELYAFVWNITLTPLGPYSWTDIHKSDTWDYLLFFPAYGEVFFDRWIYASFGYALFFTLGLGADATGFWCKILLALGFGPIFPSLKKDATGSNSTAGMNCSSNPTVTTSSSIPESCISWVGRVNTSTIRLLSNIGSPHRSSQHLCSPGFPIPGASDLALTPLPPYSATAAPYASQEEAEVRAAELNPGSGQVRFSIGDQGCEDLKVNSNSMGK